MPDYLVVEIVGFVDEIGVDSHLRVELDDDYPTSLAMRAISLVVLHLPTGDGAKPFYPQKIEAVLNLLTNGIGKEIYNYHFLFGSKLHSHCLNKVFSFVRQFNMSKKRLSVPSK